MHACKLKPFESRSGYEQPTDFSVHSGTPCTVACAFMDGSVGVARALLPVEDRVSDFFLQQVCVHAVGLLLVLRTRGYQ